MYSARTYFMLFFGSLILGSVGYSTYHQLTIRNVSWSNIPIVRQLDPICSVGSRVAVQDASETQGGVQGRVVLYKCVQDKPRWEPE